MFPGLHGRDLRVTTYRPCPAMHRRPAIYILSNSYHSTLYIGVTSNLPARIWQHRQGLVEGFTRRYRTHCLVYFEMHATMLAAITREKQLKSWRRAWKEELIESLNPEWRDLWEEILK